MIKLLLRLITLATFLCVFGTVVLFIALTSLGWIDLQRIAPGLPEPPPIDTERIPGDPFGSINVPENLRPGEAIPLRGMVQRQSLLADVPVPQQISTNPAVVGTNFFLAIAMMLIFGITSSILGNMLRDEEPRIQKWLKAFGISKLVHSLKGFFSWTVSGGVRRGCLTLPLVLLIFALYGVIFAFLDEGSTLFSRQGALLAVTLAFSVGLVSFSGDIARRIAARFWREQSSFHVYPVNLVIAAATVVLSRVVHLTPGIVFGTPGGANVEETSNPEKQARRDVTLSVLSIAVLAILGTLGWASTGVVVSSLDVVLENRVAMVVAGILNVITNLGLAIFLIALETSFYEMLPFAYSSGRPIFERNKFLWVVMFLPISFLFAHAVANPQYGFLDSFAESNVRFLWFTMAVMVGVTFSLWFYFKFVDDMLQEWMGLKRRPRTRQSMPPAPPGDYYPPPNSYDDPSSGRYG